MEEGEGKAFQSRLLIITISEKEVYTMEKQHKRWIWNLTREGRTDVWTRLSLIPLLVVIGLVLPSAATAGDFDKAYSTGIYKQIQYQPPTIWYAACNTAGRYVVVAKAPLPQSPQHIVLAGPFKDEPSARAWVNYNCPSWRCDYDGRCIPQGSGGSGNRNVPPVPDSGGTGGGVFGQ